MESIRFTYRVMFSSSGVSKRLNSVILFDTRVSWDLLHLTLVHEIMIRILISNLTIMDSA